MLGLEVAESTAGRYMVRFRRPTSQGWKTFLRNHAVGIASLDLLASLLRRVAQDHLATKQLEGDRAVTALRTFVPAAQT
jgi:hypothetical protein